MAVSIALAKLELLLISVHLLLAVPSTELVVRFFFSEKNTKKFNKNIHFLIGRTFFRYQGLEGYWMLMLVATLQVPEYENGGFEPSPRVLASEQRG